MAGQTLRLADWFVRLKGGAPDLVVNETYSLVRFDAQGVSIWRMHPPQHTHKRPLWKTPHGPPLLKGAECGNCCLPMPRPATHRRQRRKPAAMHLIAPVRPENPLELTPQAR